VDLEPSEKLPGEHALQAPGRQNALGKRGRRFYGGGHENGVAGTENSKKLAVLRRSHKLWKLASISKFQRTFLLNS
jgi:hypothetical protein